MQDKNIHKAPVAQRADLTQREFSILEAVISSYVTTAKPVGSRTLSKLPGQTLSPASIRNTMSDLEEKGYLVQPFQSAGRVPTDKAYRLHVDNILLYRRNTTPRSAMKALERIAEDPAVQRMLHRAADALSVVTRELGVGLEPVVDEGVLEGVDLIRLSSERVMLVLNIGRGLAKTIFVELDSRADSPGLDHLAARLRERLVGLTLREIKRTAGHRLREAVQDENDPLNVFVQSADNLFELEGGDRQLVLGETGRLADQPEFREGSGLRTPDRPDRPQDAAAGEYEAPGRTGRAQHLDRLRERSLRAGGFHRGDRYLQHGRHARHYRGDRTDENELQPDYLGGGVFEPAAQPGARPALNEWTVTVVKSV